MALMMAGRVPVLHSEVADTGAWIRSAALVDQIGSVTVAAVSLC